MKLTLIIGGEVNGCIPADAIIDEKASSNITYSLLVMAKKKKEKAAVILLDGVSVGHRPSAVYLDEINSDQESFQSGLSVCETAINP